MRKKKKRVRRETFEQRLQVAEVTICGEKSSKAGGRERVPFLGKISKCKLSPKGKNERTGKGAGRKTRALFKSYTLKVVQGLGLAIDKLCDLEKTNEPLQISVYPSIK